MLRIITLNANGLRSAHRKGLLPWLARQDADIVCIQETKAQVQDLPAELREVPGYRAWFHDAEKKGYSGVAIYSRHEPDAVQVGMGDAEIDAEGRFLQLDFGALSVVSIYLPSGSSGPHRQAAKFSFMERFYPYLAGLRRRRREYVLCGDWNIAHQNIDLENWRSNQKNSGFLPKERAWLTQVFDTLGWVDAFRAVNPAPRQYTWWSNRGRAWEKNVGWRIDYQIVTPGLREKILRTAIYKDERFSDHAPLTLDYDVTLAAAPVAAAPARTTAPPKAPAARKAAPAKAAAAKKKAVTKTKGSAKKTAAVRKKGR